MLLEFYRQGDQAPVDYDVFIRADGRPARHAHATPQKGVLRVLVEARSDRMPAILTNGIFRLIFMYQECTVRFHGFDQMK